MLRKILILASFMQFAFAGIAQSYEGIKYYNIVSEQLFQSKQNIHILSVKKYLFDSFSLDIVSTDTLKRLSKLANSKQAILAINGGFFNIKEAYSVSYLEKNHEVIAWTRNEKAKRANPAWMLNGAIIIDTSGSIIIDYSKEDSIYRSSKAESAILGTGPMLLKDGKKAWFEKTKFAINRHPRSCICETEEEILFIVVDGRQEDAFGVSLEELQQVLTAFHCINAVNLDGGGSSTLWTKENGVLNQPSDITGERKIANAIIIKEK